MHGMEEILYRNLKKAREYLGLSQQYVSSVLKIPVSKLCTAESGQDVLEKEEFSALSALYGLDMEKQEEGCRYVEENIQKSEFAHLSETDRKETGNLFLFRKQYKNKM